MKRIILMSMLGTLSSLGNAQITINTSSDTINIIENTQTTSDMVITGEGPYTAGGSSGNPDPNWYLQGYKVNNGAILENINKIDLNAKYDNAVQISNNSGLTNSGTINLNSVNGIGVLSADGTGSIINSSNGVIRLTTGIGIATKGYSGPTFTGTIRNDGQILSTAGGTGIFTYGSQSVKGGTVENNGVISVNGGTSATGVSITGFTTFTNNETVSGSASASSPFGALVTGNSGAQLINSSSGEIVGKNYANGMYAANNSNTNQTYIRNDGTIIVDKGYGIYSLGSKIENNGTIYSNNVGIYATKSSGTAPVSVVSNDGTIIIGANGTGIYLGQGAGKNTGEIVIAGNNAIGISIVGGSNYEGNFMNYHDISSDSDKTGVTLIKLSGSTTVGDKTAHIYNSASLTALGDNSTVIHSMNNAKIHNTGNITVNNGIGIKLEYSSLNTGDNAGLITVKGSGIGILAGASYYNGSILNNDGKIVLENNGTGIYVSSGTTYLNGTTGTNTGLIEFGGDGGTGIYVTDTKSSFTNNADFASSGKNTTGMSVVNSASVTNTGNMNFSGEGSIGINIANSGKLISNTGNISVNDGIGIRVSDSEIKDGQNTGIINVNGESGAGIAGINSKVTNNGKIYVSGMALGIYSSNSEMKNAGEIDITEGTGIAAETGSRIVNEGRMEISGSGTGIKSSGSIITNNTTGEIYVVKGTNIEASDSLVTNNALLSNEDGTGILGKNTEIINYGNLEIEKGTGISALSNSMLTNSAEINITAEGTGIKASNSEINNKSNGTITVAKGINIDSADSVLENEALLSNSDGVGINSYNSSVKNKGNIDIVNGTGILAVSNSMIQNSAEIKVTTEGTGIKASDSNINNENNGTIAVTKGVNIDLVGSYLENAALLSNSDGIGINSDNSSVKNTGNIDIENGTGILAVSNSMIQNNAEIKVTTEGTGIKVSDSNVINESSGEISVTKGVNIDLLASALENAALLSNSDGIGINADNSTVKNTGDIDIINGTAISASNGSTIQNTAYLKSGNTGITSEQSTVLNSGKIDAGEAGLYASNNIKTVNTGEINGKTAVEINAGTEEYSGHFLNTGKISGTDYAVKFDNNDSVFELGSGSVISGKIDASGGENVLILNGNIQIDSADNFNKIVSRGNSKISGIVNLNPATDYNYYTEAFSGKKNTADLASETDLGELTLSGVINVGVDYDGIVNETKKTGKIIVSGLNLQNGEIVLNNAGSTVNDITKESGLNNYGDQIRVKSIVISNKQQAVDPSFQFKTVGGMNEADGWTRETVSRIENGVTVLDELYTNLNKEVPVNPVPEPTPDSGGSTPNPKPTAAEKINAVPRNRIDLDNLNKLDTMSGKFLSMEADSMNAGERRQSIEYTGTKAGSDFKASNNLNYDYDVDSDGIAGTTLHKHTDNLYSGFTLGYTDSKVKYDNGDDEKVKSAGIDVFGKYKTGNWNLGGHIGYSYNEHGLNADWLMAGRRESDYNSHVIKTGITASYDQSLGNTGLIVTPSIGADYVMVNEGTIQTAGMADIEAATGDGAVGKIGLNLGNTSGNLRWAAGIGYEHNFTETFHKDRKMASGYIMEKLNYGKGTFNANINMDFKVTDNFTLKTGYEYENNSNYENHKFDAGISYILEER